MMPNLLHFIQRNGTLLSNNHTPLIAHTGDDILTTLTGLYGDRHGMPIANDYQAYNTNSTTRPRGLVRLLDESGVQHRENTEPGS